MDFIAQYISDNRAIEARYELYRIPAINPYIKEIVTGLPVEDHIKKAILAIDSSMRLADEVTHTNKDTTVLTTDLLSALFYRYMAEYFQMEAFKLLTQAVKDQNKWKSMFYATNDKALIEKIETAFVSPFAHINEQLREQLIEQSPLNNKRVGA